LGIDLGKGNSGVFVNEGSDLNDIRDNTLHRNGNDGIRVAATVGTRNRFDDNDFGENGDRSIDLADDERDVDDPQDTDAEPNNRQNSPQITELVGLNGPRESAIWSTVIPPAATIP